MHLLEYFLALTSFLLRCSYWIFLSANNMEVPIQGQIIPGFIWSYLTVKSLEVLVIPFLYGLQFDLWEFSTVKKTLAIWKPMPTSDFHSKLLSSQSDCESCETLGCASEVGCGMPLPSGDCRCVNQHVRVGDFWMGKISRCESWQYSERR
ncbi:uncharacterized protein [Macaca nemestrina]|uniref:uncharacterized protein isoform X3 n=1 Tax=Macaca nemestrina TaxID=9545 RepID=UPI0039B8B225